MTGNDKHYVHKPYPPVSEEFLNEFYPAAEVLVVERRLCASCGNEWITSSSDTMIECRNKHNEATTCLKHRSQLGTIYFMLEEQVKEVEVTTRHCHRCFGQDEQGGLVIDTQLPLFEPPSEEARKNFFSSRGGKLLPKQGFAPGELKPIMKIEDL